MIYSARKVRHVFLVLLSWWEICMSRVVVNGVNAVALVARGKGCFERWIGWDGLLQMEQAYRQSARIPFSKMDIQFSADLIQNPE